MNKKSKIFSLVLLLFCVIGQMDAAEVKVKLTQSMFKQWFSETTGEALEAPKSTGCDYNVGTSTGMLYGNSSVKWYTYADLTKYKALVMYVSAGTPRVMYNREMKDGEPGADGVNHIEINTNTTGGYLTVEDGVFTYDLAGMASEKGFVHINAIKGANWANVTVDKMYLIKEGELEEGEEEYVEETPEDPSDGPATKTIYSLSADDEVSIAAGELDGKVLILSDATGEKVFNFPAAQDAASANVSSWETLKWQYVKFASVTDSGCGVDGDLYTIQASDKDGNPYNLWGNPANCYLNTPPAGWVIFSMTVTAKNYGQDFDFGGLWKVEKVDGGYTIQNVGRIIAGQPAYLTPANGAMSGESVVRLFTQVSTETVELPAYPFDATEADITTFNFNEAENYDLEAGKFTANGGWTFSEPKDFSHYKWLVVTTTYNASKAGGEFRVKDAAGNSIGGEDYAKGDGASRGSMWIDRWNNQICATVSMEYIASKGIDIKKIAGVSFSANQPISAVYLTNYEAGQAVANHSGWGSCAGDYIREYSNIAENGSKFGSIALKYATAVSGAYVYTVDAFDPDFGLTISRHYGVLEAGVPYIYEAIDEVGLNGEGANCNVNFFRVDENAVSGDWSDNTARDNGLVGYYDGGFWPGAGALNGCYVLSNNALVKINGGTVQLGTNRCFFDPAKCTNKSGASSAKTLSVVSDATAIKNVNESLNSGKIYDVNGREVKSMQKGGMYIMGGMKVYVK